MKLSQRFTAVALALSMSTGAVVLPIAAQASEQGKRNTAIGLGAAAAALLLTQKNKIPGVVAAAGAAYAYKKYDDDVKGRHARERYYGYDNRGYRNSDRYNRNNSYSSDRYNTDNSYNSDRYNSDDSYASNRYDRARYDDNGYSGSDDQDCRNDRSAHRRSARRR